MHVLGAQVKRRDFNTSLKLPSGLDPKVLV